ncbi:MAG: bifunctional diaminohydroxyphosphoribosylaminopyrimidine deaminase/5-amino-6-(5-phosphoribosylamino)uracil reductase RibD [Acidimicrobiales bacterium]
MTLIEPDLRPDDRSLMARAVARAEHSRLLAPPNPWVGAVVVATDGTTYEGATQRPGAHHAERLALARAGARARGATLYVTLEPCAHHGRTPPCIDAVTAAGIERVVVAVTDPDPRVGGRGVAALRAAGIDVVVGPGADLVERQLGPYLVHRRTGRPYVVLKTATTLDGRTAAPDGTSQWITGDEARRDVHRLRAESDAILVGAGTVRADDPRLTVRDVVASDGAAPRPPLRVVLGTAPPGAAVHPCQEVSGDLEDVLDDLGRRDVVQLLVEGGATVAGELHRRGLVDHYVVYLAPALMGGDDGAPVLAGPGAATMGDLARLQLDRVVQLGNDLRMDLMPSDGAGVA